MRHWTAGNLLRNKLQGRTVPTGFNVILLHFLPPEILRGDVFARCALPIVSSSSEAKDLDGNDLSKTSCSRMTRAGDARN